MVANYAHYREAVQTAFPPARFGRMATENANAMVIGDTCHWWQCRYTDPGAWLNRFVPAGTVIIIKDRLGSRPDPNRDADTELFRVFVRVDKLVELAQTTSQSSMSRAYRHGSVGVLIPARDPNQTGLERHSREEWLAFPPGERKRRFGEYMAAVDYFGLPMERRTSFLEAAYPRVEFAYLERDLSQALDVAQAFEYAMTFPDLWRYFDS